MARGNDFRDMKPVSGQLPHKTPNDKRLPDGRDWWNRTGEDCARTISSIVEMLQKAQSPRIRQQVISSRIYGNQTSTGATGASYVRMMNAPTNRERITYNATQEIIDTLVARVGEHKPRPYYLPSGGNYKQQRKAKKLNQFIDGVFYETDTYDIGPESFRDAAIWGDGYIHVFGRGGKLRHERTWGSELWVDEVEAQYGKPRNMHRVKVVDVDELCGYFPEFRDKILQASRSANNQTYNIHTISNMVTVCESWHLGAMNEEGELEGGKHAITLVSTSTMLVEPEEWQHNFFPFARMSWCNRPIGYWSQGLCEQLQGDQIELNKELFLIQRSMHLAGSYKVLMENASKIVTEHINNEVGAIIKYSGVKPEYIVPQPIHEVYFRNVPTIIERMRNRAGVSQMQTAGMKPAGLDSGVALREFQDIESERQTSIQRKNYGLYMQLAKLDIAIASEMAKQGKLAVVRAPKGNVYNSIDWNKDIGDVDTDEFVMQCFSVSRLPRDPAGRLQTIQEYVQAGVLTMREGRRLLDFPDMDSVESLANAQEELILKTLDAIVDEGKYSPPEPTDDLALAAELSLEYIQRYRLMDLEDDKLNLLRRFLSQVNTMVKKGKEIAIQEQLAATGGAPGASPSAAQQIAVAPAAPMPPPRSDLIPNTRNLPGGGINPLQ